MGISTSLECLESFRKNTRNFMHQKSKSSYLLSYKIGTILNSGKILSFFEIKEYSADFLHSGKPNS